MSEKDLCKKIQVAFCCLLLMRIGFCTLDKVKGIAKVLNKKYVDDQAWKQIVKELLSIDNYDEVIQIMDSVNDELVIYQSAYLLLCKLCSNDQIKRSGGEL